MPDKNITHYLEFKKHMAKVADLGNAASVLSWDQQVYMPKNSAVFRGQQIATLTTLQHELFVSKKLEDAIHALQSEASLSEVDRINIELTLKDLKRKKKYSESFVEEMSITQSQAFGAWHEARLKSDFKIFEPLLKKIVELKKREAQFLGFTEHPYESLLEDYEPGLTVREIDRVFDQVKSELFPFIKKIVSANKVESDFLYRNYPKSKQWTFSEQMIKQMGYDFDSGRADDAPHPFCTTFGPGDVRITIRSAENELPMMLFAAIHEAGHALYELGLPMSEHYGLPMGSALSLAFHESQSRYWENNVARSLSFWKANYKKLQNLFPENLGAISLDQFYKGINHVEPSFIRVEADELTYHAHIYIRYLVEKALIDGELEVRDLPSFWNEKYKEYLGIEPKNDSEGCLQDVHWSYGSFGYFPTYSFGSFYAAQLAETMEKSIPHYWSHIEKGELQPILAWLRANIHASGRRYCSAELLKRTTGEELNVSHFMNYAKKKYSEIYGL